MYRLSFTSFSVARFFMAVCVFFCHVFQSFNDFGFLFVSLFFFMSGYGMEYSGKKSFALSRLVPYLFYFAWFSLIYFFFFQVWIYPSAWFLVVYFLVMFLYRFSPNFLFLFLMFLLLYLFFYFMDFNWVWSASYGAFLFGVYYASRSRLFVFYRVLIFVPFVFLFPFIGSIALWGLLPFFAWLVLSFSSFRFFRSIAFLGGYSFYFYCVHCLVLGLLGQTWTLGGSPDFWGVWLSFVLTCFLSIFLKDYLFKYPKVG